jgi:hypothetical protein
VGVDQILFWVLLIFVGVVLPALPAILRAWRKARRPDSAATGKSTDP